MKPEILPPWEGEHKPGAGEYVIVLTTYPTTYGENSHLTQNRQVFCRACDIEVRGPDGKPGFEPDSKGFDEYADAVEVARQIRDENEWFTDHNYKEDDDAPFDSAKMKNTDNDEEVLIQVMTKTDFALMMQTYMKKMFGDDFESTSSYKAASNVQISDDERRQRLLDQARREKDEFLLALVSRLEDEDDEEKVKISFGRFKFGEEEMTRIVDALKQNTIMLQLRMSWEYADVQAMKVLGKFIAEHKHLQHLILRDNTIFDDVLIPIAEGIGKNTSLLNVNLKDNNFDTKGTVALAEALKVNNTLKRLNLHNNYIYNDGAKALADALKVNNTLEWLTLTRNGVEEEGYENFAAALKINTALKQLDLHFFEFGRTGMILQKLVNYNRMDVSDDKRKELKEGVEAEIDSMSKDELSRHLALSMMGAM